MGLPSATGLIIASKRAIAARTCRIHLGGNFYTEKGHYSQPTGKKHGRDRFLT